LRQHAAVHFDLTGLRLFAVIAEDVKCRLSLKTSVEPNFTKNL
jgi:hypothetical protein